MIRLRALWWTAVVVALGVATVAVLALARTPIQTDLLALLPQTERNPVVERAVAGLADLSARRSVFLIGHRSPEQAKALSLAFAQSLSTAGVFGAVRVEFPAPDIGALRDLYLPARFQVLSPEDRRALIDDGGLDFIERRLQQRLYDPFRRGFGMSLEQDPFGLLDRYLASLPLARAIGAIERDDRGMLSVRDADRTYVLVVAELKGSAYDGDLQKRLAAALALAEGAARKLDADVEVFRAGTVHYALAARETAEWELNLIGFGSLLGIVALLFWVFRSIRPIALGLLSVAVGVAAGTLATIAAFGEIHIITLVFGASLTGEAVDYSIQYFAARLHAAKKWRAQHGLRAVLPGIVIAVLTSVLGYSALALTPFPALRQIALFAIVGLVAAFLTVALLLPALLQAPGRYQPKRLLRLASQWLARCQRWGRFRTRLTLVVMLVAVSIPGWSMLTAQDDVRLLVNPPAPLMAQERTIRRLTGVSQSNQFFVVQAPSVQQLLEREERLSARLRELMQSGGLSGYQAVSDFVPSAARQREIAALWRERVFSPPAGWRRLLAANGFRPEVADGYAAAFRQSQERKLTVESWLSSPMSAPFRQLWIGTADGGYASIVMPSGFDSVAALEQAAVDIPGVAFVDKAGSVSRLFSQYRSMGAVALAIAAVMVLGVLWFRYGWRQGSQALLPTAMGMGVTLALFGMLGIPLTLFSVMALLLVLGVSVNYVIFLREGIERRGAALIGVLLSAATTILSFGLLGWSSTPALAQFGMTLFFGILVTVVLAPLLGPISTGKSRRKKRR